MKIARPGDILISIRAPVGPTNVADVKCCIGRGLAAIRCGEMADRDFVLAALQLYEQKLSCKGAGSTFAAIKMSDLELFSFPLPPPAEQRRIVAVLSERLATVERARAALADRLKAAKVLLMAQVRAVFASTEARSWPRVRLARLCNRITDGTHIPPSFTSEGIPFLFVRNIVKGRIDFDVQNYISEATYAELTRRCCPERGDVLYTAVGSFGVAVVVDTDRPFSFQRHIAHIKPNHDLLDPWFLAFFLNSPDGRAQSERDALGGAQRTVTLKSLARFLVPAPPLEDQRKAVTSLKSQRRVAAGIVETAEAQTAAVNALPGSLLRRAFLGGL